MVQILRPKGNLDVAYGANIKGKLTWKNLSLAQGSTVAAALFLGRGGNKYVFTVDGVEYFLGSIKEVTVPAVDAATTSEILSKAMFEGTWDVQAVIGYFAGSIGTTSSGGRLIGLRKADIEAGHIVAYASTWFTNCLTVAPAGPPAEVTGFEFVAA